MNDSFGEKQKVLKIYDQEVTIRSLTLDELGIVLQVMKDKGEIEGVKIALEYGIVSPVFLRNNTGMINAEIAVLLSAEIMKLTGLAHQPPFNPSER